LRYAILADVHANYEALTAVLDHLHKFDLDGYYCVGDVVGYGADPGECLRRLQDMGFVCVAGNHDHAAVEKTSIEFFNAEARQAALWTREALSDQHKADLAALDLVHHTDDFTLVHATLHGPEMFNYVLNAFDALLCFQHLTRPVCFVGHSHVPVTFVESDRIAISFEPEVHIDAGERALVNVGSVGQPRDQDARACYAIYDTEKRLVRLHRVAYDVEAACRKITEAGLPQVNAYRLKLGQ
jgi:diadenosine tetraphosphatase ApaH/serine/threonine PP2A family protein phosphatase